MASGGTENNTMKNQTLRWSTHVTQLAQRNRISSRKERSFDSISERFVARLSRGRGTRMLFFKQEEVKLPTPVGTPIAPEEGGLERVTKERKKIGDEETHGLGRDNKLEGTLAKLGDLKLSGRATNGGLQENTNIVRGEAKLGATKSSNQGEHREVETRSSDRQTKLGVDVRLDFQTRREREARELHGGGENKDTLWKKNQQEEDADTASRS